MVSIVTAIAAVVGWSTIGSVVMFAVSMITQQKAAAKQREQQAAAAAQAAAQADAAKGTSVVSTNQIVPLKIPYGRNLVGGAIVYTNTLNSYNASAPASGGQVFESGTSLESSIGGTNHEFLITQQAICVGGIHACYDIDVDQRKLRGEYVNSFNEVVYDGSGTLLNPYTFGTKIHVYKQGGVADPLMTANDANRANSRFTNVAYSTNVYRIDRDNPQYSGVPNAQYYVEGMEVYGITGGLGARELTSFKLYSNNPALCLLDYLLNDVYGRGLHISFIDLESFYQAYLICERVVQANVPVEGSIWHSKNVTRDIKLYECNLALDSSKPIRDNIEILLETMAAADLIWSGGKYKLQLEYPTVYAVSTFGFNKFDTVQATNSGVVSILRSKIDFNVQVPVAGAYWEDIVREITDDDLIRDGETSLSWPNAGTRLNYVTVRYLNEAKDFAEDTVSWPPKTGFIESTGIFRGEWDGTFGYNRGDTVTYLGNIYQLVAGSLYINATPPSSDTTWIRDAATWSGTQAYSLSNKVTYLGVIYQRNTGINVVSANPPNVDNAWIPFGVNPVYASFMLQDSSIPLESEIFANGVSSYYHALARAEQLVRQSRTEVTYEFGVDHNHIDIEPNDFVRVTSSVLDIPGEILRVTAVAPSDKGAIKISASKYDARMLAWNAKDNEIVPIRNIYTNDLPNLTVGNITYTADDGAGFITWAATADSRIVAYQILTAQTDAGTATQWVDRGQTSSLKYKFAELYAANFIVTVVPVTARGQKAPRAGWPIKTIAYQAPPDVTGLTLTAYLSGFRLKWDPVNSARFSYVEVREGGTSFDNATFVAKVKTTEFLGPPIFVPNVSRTYRVKSVDINGVPSANETNVTITISKPSNVAISQQVIDNNVILNWTQASSTQAIDYYEIRKGTSYATSTLIGTVYGLFSTFFESSGGTFTYWITGVDIGGQYGTPTSTVIVMAQPPDFVLQSFFDSPLQSTGFHVVTSSGTTEVDTYVDPAYDVTGYSLSHLAIATGGFYQEVVDLGQGATFNLLSSNLAIALNYTTISGSPTVTPALSAANDYAVTTTVAGSLVNKTAHGYVNGQQVELSSITGTTGITSGNSYFIVNSAANTFQLSLTSGGSAITFGGSNGTATARVYSVPIADISGNIYNFRYLKLRLVVGGTGSIKLNGMVVSVKVRGTTEIGTVSALSTDATGTVVSLTKNFIDINSIVVIPRFLTGRTGAAQALSAIYDFVDIPNPISFKVYVFDGTGARVSTEVSYTVSGVA